MVTKTLEHVTVADAYLALAAHILGGTVRLDDLERGRYRRAHGIVDAARDELLLARGSQRSGDLAVRTALGAGGWHLLRLQFVETE